MATGKALDAVAVQGTITSADASDISTNNTLTNEIKADYNVFVAAFNALVADLKAKGLMEE